METSEELKDSSLPAGDNLSQNGAGKTDLPEPGKVPDGTGPVTEDFVISAFFAAGNGRHEDDVNAEDTNEANIEKAELIVGACSDDEDVEQKLDEEEKTEGGAIQEVRRHKGEADVGTSSDSGSVDGEMERVDDEKENTAGSQKSSLESDDNQNEGMSSPEPAALSYFVTEADSDGENRAKVHNDDVDSDNEHMKDASVKDDDESSENIKTDNDHRDITETGDRKDSFQDADSIQDNDEDNDARGDDRLENDEDDSGKYATDGGGDLTEQKLLRAAETNSAFSAKPNFIAEQRNSEDESVQKCALEKNDGVVSEPGTMDSAGFGSEEASLVAEQLVLNVLDRILATSDEEEEEERDQERNAAERGELASAEGSSSGRLFPALENVDLHSIHWDSLSEAHPSPALTIEGPAVAAAAPLDHGQDVPLGLDMSENKSVSEVGVSPRGTLTNEERDEGQVQSPDRDEQLDGNHQESVDAESREQDQSSSMPNSDRHVSFLSKAPARADLLEESHDGSYLWLQQQIQWRAGSKAVPFAVSRTRSVLGQRTGDAARLGQADANHNNSNVRSDERRNRSSDNSRDRTGTSTRLGKGLSASLSTSADSSGSFPSPGAIPNFRTLQDQQVSWLAMYRMLEEQHRGELQAQNAQHQRIMDDMQHHLEVQLVKQQLALKQKLGMHKEALKEPSHASNYPVRRKGFSSDDDNTEDSDREDSDRFLHRPSNENDRMGAFLSRPPVSTPNVEDCSEPNRGSPNLGPERRLYGGVYSSPLPIHSYRVPKEPSLNDSTESNGSGRKRWTQQPVHIPGDMPEQELSPRTQLSLREKHAKHMADLRAYYESELQDLRGKLTERSSSRDRGREQTLQDEIQSLRLQLREVQDALDDALIHNRSLDQKNQGLEIRAADYAARYEESQTNVLKLKNRLEELHSYTKDKEASLEQLQANDKRQAAALQEMYRAQEEQAEASRRDKMALTRLLDKYEMLEKDYNVLKDTSEDLERKLYEGRSENVDLSKQILQLELDNKHLLHDNDNLRHRLAVSGSLPLPISSREVTRSRSAHNLSFVDDDFDEDTTTHTKITNPPRRTPPRHRPGSGDRGDLDFDGGHDSPLLRAELELRRLQHAMDVGDFVPRLQERRYLSGQTKSRDVSVIDSLTTTAANRAAAAERAKAKAVTVKRERKVLNSEKGKVAPVTPVRKTEDRGKSAKTSQLAALSSPTRFDVGLQESGGSGSDAAFSRSPATSKTLPRANNQQVDKTLQQVRSGEIVSRPQWEDVYTSLAKPSNADNKASSLTATQEEMIHNRIRSVEQLEQHYDELQLKKRQLESQLNKIPTHVRDRKSIREKDLLEGQLDSVDHELGSLRMTLKRYQVLKTTM